MDGIILLKSILIVIGLVSTTLGLIRVVKNGSILNES